ncbi:DNA repair protein RecO [Riemerella anatipestifer]|uniref:DNA repair protein RecO n=1 Tax=Riemerella anatipestifer TaxID=34085 RepID=UPI0021B0A2AD|nr:recombination protein O N-terminal domain-containing protein [Riemerella anatipestifer]MCT6764266.1 recombination protein O N-terminal domain-containing protein [Riemerella anatipestifer]MCT6768508.1 recombination protein O N-terminal domain-containing protein [Riemerella anatipestifer]MCU7592962.1 recombination protein O N-terminal domain-containing protein [Riemerella anatipestifer]MCU7601184.1 recombination protein O N-terminal domain-containing protein [Riemerella anatipestifer]MCU76092
MQSLQGFILSYTKYNDSGVVLRVLEREAGIQSYFIKNIYLARSKQKVYLSPLMGVDFNISKTKSGVLPLVSQISLSEISKMIDFTLVNNAQMTLLAEFILKTVPYEVVEDSLYQCVEDFYINIDNKNSLIFTIYSIIKNIGYGFLFTEGDFFDLKNGCFQERENEFTINRVLSDILKKIGNSEFIKTSIDVDERRNVIDILMKYCKYHIPEFNEPKSLDIFREVF